MEKRTVCLLNDSFPPMIDGVANTVVNYAENIGKHYGRALVATPEIPGVEDAGYAYPVLRYPSIDTRKMVGYVTGYPFSPETLNALQEAKTDILHAHCPVSALLMARSMRKVLDAPLILTYHTKFDIDVEKAIRGKLLQEGAIRALTANISAADEVWVVSRGAGENLRSIGYEGDYIVMENGVDVPRGRVDDATVAAETAGYDLPEDVPVFLFVGRMMWYKGVRIILDALCRLRENGTAFRMVFVGSGTDAEEIRTYAEQSGLSDVCFFTGAITSRQAIRAWYARADLFLFPSTFDTNGLVVREAAGSGTATVMIAGSCAAEGVIDGRNGFFIEENAEAMAAKLTELCAHPETVRQVGENAMNELYVSWESAVARACERYEIVLDNYRRGRYPKRKNLLDEFLKSQGDLMEVLGRIDRLGDEVRQTAQRHREKWEEFWQTLDRYL